MKEGEAMAVKERKFKDETFFSKTVGLISMSGALVLSASVVYDYAYFFVFDMSFAEIPTTLSDHLRTSLNWLPRMVLILLVLFVIEMFVRRVEQGKTEEELIQSSSNPQVMARFRNHPKFLMSLAMFFAISYFLSSSLPVQVLEAPAIIIWILLHNFLYGHERIMKRSSKDIYMLSRWVPLILIVMFIQGYAAAGEIEKGRGNSYVFLTEKGITTSVLARTFDKHYMLWDENKGKIMLLSMDAVIKYYPEDPKKELSKKIQPAQKSDKTQSAQESKKTKPEQKSDKTNQAVQ